jgi:hypothetical protein
MILAGYILINWALGMDPGGELRPQWSVARQVGDRTAAGPASAEPVFSESAPGLVLAALLIGPLPRIYAALPRRVAAMPLLGVRAGCFLAGNRPADLDGTPILLIQSPGSDMRARHRGYSACRAGLGSKVDHAA